jgi:hypothetical protein
MMYVPTGLLDVAEHVKPIVIVVPTVSPFTSPVIDLKANAGTALP